MAEKLKYVPIFRCRQQEFSVLKSFDFGNRIYPCVEIIKELDRAPSKARKVSQGLFRIPVRKTFESVYIPFIRQIKADKVFVDLPTHLKPNREMKPETLSFLTKVVTNREKRTEYLKRLKPVADKIIPVISTYSEVTGERNSITNQEDAIRKDFKTLAFRTFLKTFPRDIPQIRSVLKSGDYLIMDWEDNELDFSDGDITDIVEELDKLDCNIIAHRNPFPQEMTYSGMKHGEVIDEIDNSLVYVFKKLAGTSFSDYVGIKKDKVGRGGVISPGFVYYDAVNNNFFGYRYKEGSHKKGKESPKLEEFETTIIPAVIESSATSRMKAHSLDFLGEDNRGWKTIKNIEIGEPLGESGKSAAKFKRIGMEHYLHCMRIKINNGDFD